MVPQRITWFDKKNLSSGQFGFIGDFKLFETCFTSGKWELQTYLPFTNKYAGGFNTEKLARSRADIILQFFWSTITIKEED